MYKYFNPWHVIWFTKSIYVCFLSKISCLISSLLLICIDYTELLSLFILAGEANCVMLKMGDGEEEIGISLDIIM